jgi:hypothetical protein
MVSDFVKSDFCAKKSKISLLQGDHFLDFFAIDVFRSVCKIKIERSEGNFSF